MPKLKVTIVTREEAVIDTGDLPARMIEVLLRDGDGAFGAGMSSYGLSDVGNPTFTTDSITVEEIKPASAPKKK